MKNLHSGLLLFFVTICFVATGCSISETKKANALVDQIQNNIESGNYCDAILLIDSLNKTFPEQTEARKTTLLSRAQAMEGLIRDSIYITETEMVKVQLELDSLKQFFIPVQERNLPGYIIDKTVKDVNLLKGNAIQPRLGDALSPWVLEVSTTGKSEIYGLQTTIDGHIIDIRANNAQNRRVEGSGIEMLSFSCDEVDILGNSLSGFSSQPLKLTVLGNKKNVEIIVSPEIQNAIWRTYRFALLRDNNQKLHAKRELLERKLIVAQNQIVNFQTLE